MTKERVPGVLQMSWQPSIRNHRWKSILPVLCIWLFLQYQYWCSELFFTSAAPPPSSIIQGGPESRKRLHCRDCARGGGDLTHVFYVEKYTHTALFQTCIMVAVHASIK